MKLPSELQAFKGKAMHMLSKQIKNKPIKDHKLGLSGELNYSPQVYSQATCLCDAIE